MRVRFTATATFHHVCPIATLITQCILYTPLDRKTTKERGHFHSCYSPMQAAEALRSDPGALGPEDVTAAHTAAKGMMQVSA